MSWETAHTPQTNTLVSLVLEGNKTHFENIEEVGFKKHFETETSICKEYFGETKHIFIFNLKFNRCLE